MSNTAICMECGRSFIGVGVRCPECSASEGLQREATIQKIEFDIRRYQNASYQIWIPMIIVFWLSVYDLLSYIRPYFVDATKANELLTGLGLTFAQLKITLIAYAVCLVCLICIAFANRVIAVLACLVMGVGLIAEIGLFLTQTPPQIIGLQKITGPILIREAIAFILILYATFNVFRLHRIRAAIRNS